MNRELARKVADSVLYEGYMLYPYRPSALKNRQRWSFGILYPPAYPEVALGTERSSFHSECLVETTADVVIHVQLRFLHLFSRQYAAVVDGISEPVPSLFVDDQRFDSWDEPIERSVEFPVTILSTAQQHRFTFPASLNSEPMLDRQGQLAGTVTRTQREVTGIVSITTQFVRDGLIKLALDVTNTTAMPEPPANRNAALLCSLLSAHAILSSTAAQFVSLLDPPDELQNAAASLRNVGNFPVLVGFPPERDMMLCSPIVLYDYPQIAPESVSNFFDSTEMDEMLTLRMLTLTDSEQDQMLRADDRLRDLLQRTQQSAREQLSRTHGIFRSVDPTQEHH